MAKKWYEYTTWNTTVEPHIILYLYGRGRVAKEKHMGFFDFPMTARGNFSTYSDVHNINVVHILSFIFLHPRYDFLCFMST